MNCGSVVIVVPPGDNPLSVVDTTPVAVVVPPPSFADNDVVTDTEDTPSSFVDAETPSPPRSCSPPSSIASSLTTATTPASTRFRFSNSSTASFKSVGHIPTLTSSSTCSSSFKTIAISCSCGRRFSHDRFSLLVSSLLSSTTTAMVEGASTLSLSFAYPTKHSLQDDAPGERLVSPSVPLRTLRTGGDSEADELTVAIVPKLQLHSFSQQGLP